MKMKQCLKKLTLAILCLSSGFISAEAEWEVVPLKVDTTLKSIEFIGDFGWIVEGQHWKQPNKNAGFFTTKDGGKTWRKHKGFFSRNVKFVEFISDQTGWVLAEDRIWRTTDGGISWFLQGDIPPTDDIADIDFVDEKNGWIVVKGLEGASVYATQDGGENWVEQVLSQGFFTAGIKFYDAGSGWVIPWGGDGGLFYTSNGGDTWTVRETGGIYYMEGLDMLSQQEGWAAGYAFTGSGGNCAAGMDYTTHIYHIEGETITDIKAYCSANNPGDIDFVDKKQGWLVSNEQILSTKDGGLNWSKEYVLSDSDDYIRSLQMISEDQGWAVSRRGVLLKYSDRTETTEKESCPKATITGDLYSHLEDLKLHIPSIKFDSPLGVQHLQADFAFHSKDDVDDKELWRLVSYASLENPCVDENTATVDSDLNLQLPLLQNVLLTGTDNIEAGFVFSGVDEHQHLLWKWSHFKYLLKDLNHTCHVCAAFVAEEEVAKNIAKKGQ